MKPMKRRYLRLLDAIVAYREEHGYSPKIRELIEMTDFTSTSVVSYGLRQLRKHRLIDFVDGESRTITLKEERNDDN